MTKSRSKKSKVERIGVNEVESHILNLGHIWREQPIEDVGVDGIVEVCEGEFPTGKLIGIQVKSGDSYIRNETNSTFTFYPDSDDLEYWSKLTLPLIIVFYEPKTSNCYWKNLSSEIQNREGDLFKSPSLKIDKSSRLDSNFNDHILRLFDLTVPSDEQFEKLTSQLLNTRWKNGDYDIEVSALDIFINGLWGLCTKLLFHLSLITDTFKTKLVAKEKPSMIRMRLDRDSLQPFVIEYLRLLNEYRLVILDNNDINHTLYVKWEWPTFIAPFTLAGRKYIEFLRKKYHREKSIRDNQFFNLSYYPHVFIEVFDNWDEEKWELGKIERSFIISFNRYLNDYILQDIWWDGDQFHAKNLQHISFEEIKYYFSQQFGDIDKDRIMVRLQDEFISPFTCWIEDFTDNSTPIPLEELEKVAPSETRIQAMELNTIFSFGSTTYETQETDFQDPVKVWLSFHAQKFAYEAIKKGKE